MFLTANRLSSPEKASARPTDRGRHPGRETSRRRPGLLGRLVSDWGGWCLCGVAVAAPGQESVEGALEGVCDVDLAALDVELSRGFGRD